MAYLAEVYFKKETIKTLLDTLQAKGENGLSIVISINNEVKEFTTPDGKVLQQNVSAYVAQNKEQREAKKAKFYVANGRQVWSDDTIAPTLKLYKEGEATAAPKTAAAFDQDGDSSDLPF
jgi:hypothetical protein